MASPLPLPNLLSCSDPGHAHHENTAFLTAENDELRNKLDNVKKDYAIAVEECERAHEMVNILQEKLAVKTDPDIHNNQVLIKQLKIDLENLVIENEKVKRLNEDIEKKNIVKKELVDRLNKELQDSKVKFKRERGEMIKSHKAEVKYWRKELGEQTKINIKLEKKLEDAKNQDLSKPTKKKETVSEKSTFRNEKTNEITCSICASNIPDFTPEYFCGELLNPACDACKACDSLWNPDDPFSSFSSPCQPTSLVSHWLLPSEKVLPQNPSSFLSMVSHFIPHQQNVENEEKLVTKEEFLELFEEFRAQLRADREQMLQEIKKNIRWLN